MTIILAKKWTTLAWRGAAILLFGVLTLLWPGLTLTTLALLFAVFACCSGILALSAAFADHPDSSFRIFLFVEGLLGIVTGILGMIWPWAIAIAFVYLIAAWSVISGISQILTARQLRKHIQNEWLLGLGGVLSLGLGILLALWPIAGAMALAWVVGIYALVFGTVKLALAFKLRAWSQRMESPSF